MNKMFLKAISAHIRGLIKPNRVELWLILSYRVLSYQSDLDIQCTSYHGGKEEAVDGSTLLESYLQLSTNQKHTFGGLAPSIRWSRLSLNCSSSFLVAALSTSALDLSSVCCFCNF